MRMLFTSTNGLGHLIPLFPVARAAAAAGHEVSFASPRPDPPQVAALGLPHDTFDLPSNADRDAAIREHSGPGDPAGEPPPSVMQKVASEMFGRLLPLRALPRLRSVMVTRRPDVVISESAEFAGSLLAEAFGVPFVRVHYGLTMRGIFERHVAPQLSRLREELGLPADPQAKRLLDAPQICYFPSAFEGTGTDAAHIHRVRQGTAAAADRAERPARADLVHVSFGTEVVTMPFFPQLVRDGAQAVAATGRRAHVSVGLADPDQFGDLTDAGAQIERWVNHDELIPTLRAIVCHAGAGTTLRALTAGTPIIVVPQFSDQPMIAGRIVATRVGASVPHGPGFVPRLTAALEQILASEPPGCEPMVQAMRDLPNVYHAVDVITAAHAGAV